MRGFLLVFLASLGSVSAQSPESALFLYRISGWNLTVWDIGLIQGAFRSESSTYTLSSPGLIVVQSDHNGNRLQQFQIGQRYLNLPRLATDDGVGGIWIVGQTDTMEAGAPFQVGDSNFVAAGGRDSYALHLSASGLQHVWHFGSPADDGLLFMSSPPSSDIVCAIGTLSAAPSFTVPPLQLLGNGTGELIACLSPNGSIHSATLLSSRTGSVYGRATAVDSLGGTVFLGRTNTSFTYTIGSWSATVASGASDGNEMATLLYAPSDSPSPTLPTTAALRTGLPGIRGAASAFGEYLWIAGSNNLPLLLAHEDEDAEALGVAKVVTGVMDCLAMLIDTSGRTMEVFQYGGVGATCEFVDVISDGEGGVWVSGYVAGGDVSFGPHLVRGDTPARIITHIGPLPGGSARHEPRSVASLPHVLGDLAREIGVGLSYDGQGGIWATGVVGKGDLLNDEDATTACTYDWCGWEAHFDRDGNRTSFGFTQWEPRPTMSSVRVDISPRGDVLPPDALWPDVSSPELLVGPTPTLVPQHYTQGIGTLIFLVALAAAAVVVLIIVGVIRVVRGRMARPSSGTLSVYDGFNQTNSGKKYRVSDSIPHQTQMQ